MSRRASLVTFALLWSCSPSSDWTGGSSATSWHTSCITLPVKLRIARYDATPSTLQWRKTMHGQWKMPVRKRSERGDGLAASCNAYAEVSRKADFGREKP